MKNKKPQTIVFKNKSISQVAANYSQENSSLEFNTEQALQCTSTHLSKAFPRHVILSVTGKKIQSKKPKKGSIFKFSTVIPTVAGKHCSSIEGS